MLDVSNPFFTDVAQGIDVVAGARDLILFLCNSGNSTEREAAAPPAAAGAAVHGILVTPVDPPRRRRGDGGERRHQDLVAFADARSR